MGLTGRQHPRLVNHDQGLAADLDLSLGGKFEELVDAIGPRIAIVPQRHRRPPRHRRRHDLVAVLPVEVGNGAQRGGLARARRAHDRRHAAAPSGGVADCKRLLLAQRIALLQQRMELLLHRLGGEAVAVVRRHGLGHVPHRLFEPKIVAR